MTDEELKKALHWCGEDTCSGCPLEKYYPARCRLYLTSEAYGRISLLEAENAALRKRLEKAATFALNMCNEDDCAGDGSVGLSPCDMWHAWDTDGNGVNIESGCYLKEYLTELKGERNDTF